MAFTRVLLNKLKAKSRGTMVNIEGVLMKLYKFRIDEFC